MKILLISLLFLISEGTSKTSWYGEPFHGRKTAHGEIFNMYDYTCASTAFKYNTKLKITNLTNNKFVIVRVNDRGPFVFKEGKLHNHPTRIVDLSYQAFKDIANPKVGVISIKYEVYND
jgi:rare lipoprotein A